MTATRHARTIGVPITGHASRLVRHISRPPTPEEVRMLLRWLGKRRKKDNEEEEEGEGGGEGKGKGEGEGKGEEGKGKEKEKEKTEPRPTAKASKMTPEQAAIIIQKYWRGTLVRRSLRHATISALVIQRWWKRVSTRLHDERRTKLLLSYIWPEKASVLIQSMFRMWHEKIRYKKYQNAAHIIQNYWRLYAFRKDTNIGFLSNLVDGGIDLNIEIIVE